MIFLNLHKKICRSGLLLVLFCSVGFQPICFAQSPSDIPSFADKKFGAKDQAFGIVTGFAYSNFVGANVDKSDFKTGLVIGAFHSGRINEHLYFQQELLYVNKGYKGYRPDDFNFYYDYKAEVKLSYVDIPFLFKFYIPTLSRAKPNIFVGPAISLLLSAKADLNGTNGQFKYSIENIQITDALSNLDLGIIVGGAVDFEYSEYGDRRIIIDLRFTIGVMDILSDDEEKFLYNYPNALRSFLDGKNASFNLTVGYQL